MSPVDASAGGQFSIGGISINRLGYSAMRITGPGVWGPPPDRIVRTDQQPMRIERTRHGQRVTIAEINVPSRVSSVDAQRGPVNQFGTTLPEIWNT